MKKWMMVLLAASVLLQGTLNTVTAQHKHRTDKESHKIICYYSDSLNVGYFPPPEQVVSHIIEGLWLIGHIGLHPPCSQ
ncbi:hypothetical protein LCGC14_2877730, partial [marine sediment metagenome]